MPVNKIDELKSRIEKEREKLNCLIEEQNAAETYRQSLVVDELVEEFIALTLQSV